MSLAKFYPFNGARDRLRLGLKTISSSEWIVYEDDFPQRILEKRKLISEQRGRVLQSTEASHAAESELLENILLYIKQYKSDLFTIENEKVICHANGEVYELSDYEQYPLELISYLAPDDFCLLEKFADDYRLVAASVCSPTYWELSEKISKPMKNIHGPIPNLENKIGRMIRHFLVNLKTDMYYQRSNWFLLPNDDLPLFKDEYIEHQDAIALDITNIEENLFLRSERQTFRKMYETENIVFGINIYIAPLSIVKQHPAIAEDLMIAMDTMSAEQKKLVGIGLNEGVLKEYLNAFI